MTFSVAEFPWLPLAPEEWAQDLKKLDSLNAGADLQRFANFRLSDAQVRRLARQFRKNLATTQSEDLLGLSSFRLAILSSTTLDVVTDSLPVAALRYGVCLQHWIAPFGQIVQEALNPKSVCNSGQWDAALIAADPAWLGINEAITTGDPAGRVHEAIKRIESVIAGLSQHSATPAILCTVVAPERTLFGSYDRQQAGTIRSMIEEFNQQLSALAERKDCYLLDVAALARMVGLERWFNPVQWHAYKFPFDVSFGPIYCDWLCRVISAIRGKSKKCLVLDLDNTLWDGAIGDDGVEGISVGEGTARGAAHLALQHYARSLRARGIFLAVCSKNDEHVARRPFRSHPGMALQESDISVFQANWSDKSQNLVAIAEALNIGLDALVMVDDNPAERAQIRSHLPQVAVPELPADPAYFEPVLTMAGYFEALAFSREDSLRVAATRLDDKRAEIQRQSSTVGEYLKELSMRIVLKPFDQLGRKRIVQLVNKTNQFNLTTCRYTDAQIDAFTQDTSTYTLQVELADKFSDLGMISVVICRTVEHDSASWLIDTWLMSCRALARTVEIEVLRRLISDARAKGIRNLIGQYKASAKNSMVADHYEKLGFKRGRDPEGTMEWRLDCSDFDDKFPHYFAAVDWK